MVSRMAPRPSTTQAFMSGLTWGWASAPILHWSDILELQMRRGIEEMMGVEELRMAKILGYCDVKEKWHVWLNSVFKCIKIADAVDSPNEEGERKERQKCHQKGSGEMQRSLYHVCCKSANLFHIKLVLFQEHSRWKGLARTQTSTPSVQNLS